MLFLYCLIAIYIAWIWVDYYRLIDIYEEERLKYFILTFFLGACSVFIVFGVNRYFLDQIPFVLNGDLFNDFLYSVFKIGLVEEVSKTIPFLLLLFLFKKEFNEPIDYLSFICISALGFSAAENVLYFNNHGPYIINNRAILSTVGHMFDTSLIAYGIILYKYKAVKNKIFVLANFVFLAALSHGFYDFWLIYEGARSWGWLVTIVYFLVTISVFAVILNNALNNSNYFTYKRVVNSDMVARRLLIYYAFVFLIQFVLLSFTESVLYALSNFKASIFFSGFIIMITCVRLSRFKLIKNRWGKLKIEFPVSVSYGDPYGMKSSRLRFVIKGEAFNETYINIYYEEFFYLNPLSAKATYLRSPRLTFIEKKVFLKDDETFYVAKVFHGDEFGVYETLLLRPKTSDVIMVNAKYPIVAVLKMNNESDIENFNLSVRDFKFKEWAFIKPKQQNNTI